MKLNYPARIIFSEECYDDFEKRVHGLGLEIYKGPDGTVVIDFTDRSV